MRGHLCLLLALCAMHARAVPSRADEGFCPTGTADNWLPLSPDTDVPELVQDALAEEVSLLLERLSEDANSTWVPCSNATVTTEGCLQSVAGTNYWLRINVSCPDYDFPDTVQLEATIYDPLDDLTRPTIGLNLVEQPEGPPEGFDPFEAAQDWVAIPDDAALFQQLPYEREELVAAAPADAAGEAPAPAPSPEEDGSGGEEEQTEEEVDPASPEEDGVDAEQEAAEQQQRRR